MNEVYGVKPIKDAYFGAKAIGNLCLFDFEVLRDVSVQKSIISLW